MLRRKHPKELKFRLGYQVTVGSSQVTVKLVDKEAAEKQDLIYVAIVDNGICVKVGRTTSGLKGRWQRVFQMLEAEPPKNLRQNEKSDRRKLLDLVSGKTFEIWFKPASTCEINLCSDFGPRRLSVSAAEEEYLDAYYEPKFGSPLPLRRRAKK